MSRVLSGHPNADLSDSTDAGHYVACVKQGDGRWTHYNDEQVQVFKVEQMLKINPYLLFYKKKHCDDVV